jgi:hypothetical protein
MNDLCFVYGCTKRFHDVRGIMVGTLSIGIRLCDHHLLEYDDATQRDCERAGFIYEAGKVHGLITRVKFFAS